jgi:hypothetical protein
VDRSVDPWCDKDRSSRNWFAASISIDGDDLKNGEVFLTDGAVNDIEE